MITMTKRAVEHSFTYLENRGKGIGIRIAIRASGCNGLMYVIEPVDVANQGDLVSEIQGLSIFIDPKSLVYLKGSELDYTKQGLNAGFLFKNPNVKNECGCGESFTT